MNSTSRATNTPWTTPLIAMLLAACAIGCGDDDPGPAGTADASSDVVFPDAAPLLDAASTGDTASLADATPSDAAATPDTEEPDAATVDTVTPDTTQPDTTSADTTLADTALADTADTADTADAPGPTCPSPGPAHTRHVVLSRPYLASGGPSSAWEVRPLLGDGTLGAVAATFAMGRATSGVVAFSPDGGLGFAAQDDGSLGVFGLDAAGQPTVHEAALDPGAYVTGVVVDGDRLLLVDSNWPNNGGGVYAAPWDCFGVVGAATRLYPSKNAAAVAVTPAGDHLVAAREAGDTTFGHVHLLRDTAPGWTRVGGADAFGDDDAILSAFAVMADGRYALVGDYSAFSGVPNRVGALSVSAAGVVSAGVLSPIDDPYAIVASPYGDAALVISGFSNSAHVVAYEPDGVPVFTDLGPPSWVGQAPQLPSDAVLVGPSHPGLVLVVENVAVRRLRFDGDAQMTDLGRTAEGAGLTAIPGAIGVQP